MPLFFVDVLQDYFANGFLLPHNSQMHSPEALLPLPMGICIRFTIHIWQEIADILANIRIIGKLLEKLSGKQFRHFAQIYRHFITFSGGKLCSVIMIVRRFCESF